MQMKCFNKILRYVVVRLCHMNWTSLHDVMKHKSDFIISVSLVKRFRSDTIHKGKYKVLPICMRIHYKS